MGKLLYTLIFQVFSDDDSFKNIKISPFDNNCYGVKFNHIDYNLNLDIQLVDKYDNLIPISITKDISILKSINEPMLVKCVFTIDTNDNTSLFPLICSFDDHLIKTKYLSQNDIVYQLQNGYKLQVDYDLLNNLKIYSNQKENRLFNISHICLIDHKIVDSNLKWWIC